MHYDTNNKFHYPLLYPSILLFVLNLCLIDDVNDDTNTDTNDLIPNGISIFIWTDATDNRNET